METSSPKPISFFLQSPKRQEKKGRRERERDAPFNELYSLYTSESQRKLRRVENWKRYRHWLMSKHIPHTPESVEKFKKVKSGVYHLIEEWNVTTFSVKISHIKTHDLYYILSVARDKENRCQPIGAWLFQKPR